MMFITRRIDGKLYQIELTKEELKQVTHMCYVEEFSTRVKDYIATINIDNFNNDVKTGFEKYAKCSEELRDKFHQYCAEGIISRADEYCVSLSDDLTDIFDEEICNSFENFDEIIIH